MTVTIVLDLDSDQLESLKGKGFKPRPADPRMLVLGLCALGVTRESVVSIVFPPEGGRDCEESREGGRGP